MVTEQAEEQYREYLKCNDTRWEFGNRVLYDMCQQNPYHNQSDIIVGKIWIIGRSYAAAIERRKNAKESNDDFYYEVVAPKMLEIGSELDLRLTKLRTAENSVNDNAKAILETHKLLMDTFYGLTGLEKRSLASKYLHFHCPEMFFIYDSRARLGMNKYVKYPDRKILNGIECDREYGDFFCRMIEFQNYIHNKLGIYQSPRQLDSFLLNRMVLTTF